MAQALSGGGGVWNIINVEIMAAIIATMATNIIDKVTVFTIGNIWFQGMGGEYRRGKNPRSPSPSPLGEGGRLQSLSSSRLQPSSIVSSCGRHLGGGEGVGDTIVVEILTATNIAMVPSIITKNMTVVAIINIFLSGMGGGREIEGCRRRCRWGGRKQSLSSSRMQSSSIFS